MALPNCHFIVLSKLSHFLVTKLSLLYRYQIFTFMYLPNCHFQIVVTKCSPYQVGITKLSLPNYHLTKLALPNCDYQIVITKLSLPIWCYQKSARRNNAYQSWKFWLVRPLTWGPVRLYFGLIVLIIVRYNQTDRQTSQIFLLNKLPARTKENLMRKRSFTPPVQ